MRRMTSRAAVLAVAAVLVLPTPSSRAQPSPPVPSGQPPSPPPVSQSGTAADSDRNTAVRLLDQVETLLQGAMAAPPPQKSKLKNAGTVQVDRATLDEALALVVQVKTMLNRGRP
jgi:hypothetical protein